MTITEDFFSGLYQQSAFQGIIKLTADS